MTVDQILSVRVIRMKFVVSRQMKIPVITGGKLAIGLLCLMFFTGCNRQFSSKESMNNSSSSPWDQVMSYAESVEVNDTGLGYGDVGNALAANHPPGYARCYAVWWADADITNGGFYQFFHNPTGNLVLIAIECFEHIGEDKMASIFKSALLACSKQYPEFIRYEIPDGYFDDFKAISDDLEALSDMYYEQKYKLPGKTHETCYFDDFVANYWATRPAEFHPYGNSQPE